MNFKRKSPAFTLIEMLVTLSIVTLLTTMVLVYSRHSESITNLIRDSDRLVFNLHQVQNSSLLTLQQSSSSSTICGWGIHLDLTSSSTSYLLFHDLCGSTTTHVYDPGEEYETVNLLKGVIFTKSDFHDIVFVPPNPDIYVDGSNNVLTNSIAATICLAADTNTCFVITINPAGQVSKEQI
ncbi:MAG: type II secretion system protein [Minisyncoccia bacterium]